MKDPQLISESFFIVLDGMPCTVTGKIVAQIGIPAPPPDPPMVFTFIKGNDGNNYVKRKGKCSCCEEFQEDCIKFQTLKELQEYAGDSWLFEAVFNSMHEPSSENLH